MSGINGIAQSNLLAGYLNSTSNSDLDAKNIFKKLSIDTGGGGKEINKEQLDSYIENIKTAKAQKVDNSGVSTEELNGLTKLQKDWDKISLGSDSITYSNISASGNKETLLAMDTADKPKVDIKKLKESETDINAYLVDSALKFSADDNGKSAKSLLNTLLTGTTDENDDSNADLIGKLVNIIEDYKKMSTIEEEA